MIVEHVVTSLLTGKTTRSTEEVADPVVDPVAELAAERAIMECTPLQGILTLGEAEWGKVLAYRNGDEATWAEKIIIDDAQIWRRNSENIAFFQHLLQYSDEQVDALFRNAKQVEA